MTTLLNPTAELIQQNPEVKSYIYQQIGELEGFVTPETIVSVVARDPQRLALQLETEGKEFAPEKLEKLYRVAIVLNESGATVEAEGFDENIFVAIRMAKNNLLDHLIAVQDSVVSQQDRLVEINHYLQPPVLH